MRTYSPQLLATLTRSSVESNPRQRGKLSYVIARCSGAWAVAGRISTIHEDTPHGPLPGHREPVCHARRAARTAGGLLQITVTVIRSRLIFELESGWLDRGSQRSGVFSRPAAADS